MLGLFSNSDDYKKTDSKRAQRGAVLSVSTGGLLVACVLFVLFVYEGRRPNAAESRQRNVELDEEGYEICHVPDIRRPEEFFDDIETVTAQCGSMVQLGKTAVAEVIHEDYGTATVCNHTGAHFQWVCLDKRLKIAHPGCLAYSVGVDPDFRFEHDLEQLGCEVYAFDTRDRVDDHQRSDRIWFQNVRIGSNSFDGYSDGNHIEKARMLHQVVENLGHKHRVIDVLKLDIRDHEWEALEEFVRSEVMDQVKQLIVTLNFDKPLTLNALSQGAAMMEQLHTYYQLIRMLDCDGFRVFSAEGRGEPVKVAGMKRNFHKHYEISYINTNFYH